MYFSFIGDCQVARACTMFIQEYGPEIIQRNMCRNLVLHLANLADFGLIKPDCVAKTTLQNNPSPFPPHNLKPLLI